MSAANTSVASLVKRAEKGDARAMSAFREKLPVEIDAFLLEEYGDLGKTAENVLIKAVAGDNLLHAEGLKLKAEQLKADLEGPDPSPLERLLVERIVCCWILANYADAIYGQGMADRSWAADECLQRRQDKTERRLAHACKALAQIRKLLGPNIQINVAEKQVNVMPAGA